MVRAAERERKRPYSSYARVRLDTQLFAPVPKHWFEYVVSQSPGGATAVVPRGNEFGADPYIRVEGADPFLHVTDKLIIASSRAFDADASVWQSMIDSSVPELSSAWNAEGLHTAHLLRVAKAQIVRAPIAFCVLSMQGACRYPEELLLSLGYLQAQPPPRLLYNALRAGLPEYCGSLGVRPCDSNRSDFPQTNLMIKRDPGFCALAKLCSRARQSSQPVARQV